MTSEFRNEEDNVENIDMVAGNDVSDSSGSVGISEVELLPHEDDGDFDDDEAQDAENTDYDAQSAPGVHVAAPAKQTVVIETLPITGEPRVDDALSRLSDLEGLPVHEHGDVFEDVRRRLHGTLSDLSGQ